MNFLRNYIKTFENVSDKTLLIRDFDIKEIFFAK